MATFVLIHGSWQGNWCWREVIPRLEAQGHQPVAIDLPGHGQDPTPPETVQFQDYVDRTLEAVRAAAEPPILVGHSMGGAIISQAAEVLPDRIRGLVFVAALAPPNGAAMATFFGAFDPEYLAQFQWAPDRRTALISSDAARQYAYQHCPPGTTEFAFPLFRPEPVAPFETPLSLTGANFGRLPRYYIECLRDRIVPIALQRSMREAVPFDDVFSLDTDHAPYFSAPEDLVRILHDIAGRV